MNYNVNKLKEKIQYAYNGKMGDFPKEQSVGNALKVFKEIKNYESYDGDGKRDYKAELFAAQTDLALIFNCVSELKGLTKNQTYMFHQSKMVNAIYELLGE